MKNDDQILMKAMRLIEYWKAGYLGGEIMPEDQNPNYPVDSKENYIYFTLPMALNYQRNSYKLWESANKSANDPLLSDIFIPKKVIFMSDEELRDKLVKNKIALQMNKQPVIWKRLCQTFNDFFNGDVREFFKYNNNSVAEIKEYMLSHKKDFPYLSGNKIMNYWLYVMVNYTDLELKDRHNISVAPDTNVVQASLKLDVINEQEFKSSNVQEIVAKRWEKIFSVSDYDPIDIHTPLWLWTRSKFPYLEELQCESLL